MWPPKNFNKCFLFNTYKFIQIASFSLTSQKLIINGINCTNEPWVAEIIISHGQKWKHLCGGALIHPNWVITAAHSFFQHDKGNKPFAPNNAYKVCIGSPRQCHGLQYNVCSIHHPSFEITMNKKIILNDLALIQLPWRVPKHIARPIQLATDPSENYCDRTAYIYGWGATKLNEAEVKEFSPVLQEGTVYVGDNNTCNDITTRVDDGKICIDCDLSPSIACSGDSGGPLVLKQKNGNNILIGISSYGDSNYGDWDIYTRITSYSDWIYHITKIKEIETFINEYENLKVTELH